MTQINSPIKLSCLANSKKEKARCLSQGIIEKLLDKYKPKKGSYSINNIKNKNQQKEIK